MNCLNTQNYLLPDVKLRKEKVELGNLLSQLVGEYIPIFENNN